MNEKRAVVFDIQRFSLNDGPGIRTIVFLKGCPLNCLWCHNPESKSQKSELMLYLAKCIGCGDCVSACADGLHSFGADGQHIIDRKQCRQCGACEAACSGAIKLCGKPMSVDEVLREVMKDSVFYANSGGGLTISGGEPLMQADFTLALLKAAKESGIHTAIETSGYAKWEVIDSLADYVDLFLWDVKESDSDRHKTFTGVDNTLILSNLHRLNDRGAKVVLRCPIIPGCNDRKEHLEAIGRMAEELSCVERVDIEPYHPMGKSKAEALGREYPLDDLTFPSDEAVKEWCEAVSRWTTKAVAKS